MNYDCHYTLVYPLPGKLKFDLDEGTKPHLFNYFAFSGKQIVLYRGRKNYFVACANWLPICSVVKTVTDNWTIVVETADLYFAKNQFRQFCIELLNIAKYVKDGLY